MNKKFVILLIAIVLGSISFSGLSRVYAKGFQGNTPSIINAIATKFNLKESDVQAVFDQKRQERQQNMEKRFEDNLTQAVTDGKITESKKQLLLAKHEEMQKSREQNRTAFQAMSPEEKKAEREKQRQDMQNWASQNNINLNYLGHGLGMRGHMK